MKKLFAIIIVIVAFVASTNAQTTDLYPFTKGVVKKIDGKDSIVAVTDSSLVIDRIYAGSLSGTMFNNDSLYATGFTGVRFGTMATYKPASWISFSSWAMLQFDGGAQSWNLQQFWMTLNPSKKLTFQIGSMATLVTEQRPHPVSGDGQFETWSEATIPGGTLNAKLKYDFTSDFQLAAGIAVRSNMPEYSARLIYKNIKLYGWYATADSTSGIAASIKLFDRVSSTLVYKPDQTIADILVIKVSEKHNLSLYSDMGYSFTEKDLVRGEWGILKGFDSKWIDGLFGLGYQYESKSIAGYLFVHL